MITRVEFAGLIGETQFIKAPKAPPSWEQTRHNHTDHYLETDESLRYWNPTKAVFFESERFRVAWRASNWLLVKQMIEWCSSKRFSLVVVAQCKCYDEQDESERMVGFLFRKKEHAMRFKLRWQI